VRPGNSDFSNYHKWVCRAINAVTYFTNLHKIYTGVEGKFQY